MSLTAIFEWVEQWKFHTASCSLDVYTRRTIFALNSFWYNMSFHLCDIDTQYISCDNVEERKKNCISWLIYLSQNIEHTTCLSPLVISIQFRGVLVLGGKDRNSFSIWKQHKRSKNTMGCYRGNIAWVTDMADITASFSAVPVLKIIISTD